MINITVMLKNGGYTVIKSTPSQLGQLAKAIYENGFEWVTLQSGPIAVVGIMVTGNQTGDRVIILGNKEPQATGTTEIAQ